MDIETLMASAYPYEFTKRTVIDAEFTVSTLRDLLTGKYETCVLNSEDAYLLYIGNSKWRALWIHWRAKRAVKKGQRHFQVIASTKDQQGPFMVLHEPKTMNVVTPPKGEKVVNLDDYR